MKRRRSASRLRLPAATRTSSPPVTLNWRAMIDLLEQHRDAIAGLCRKHHVRRLDVFGSASTGEFDPARSDIDFVVEFDEMPGTELLDHYFVLQDALEDISGTRVDLLLEGPIENWIFRESMQRSRANVYAA